MTLKKKTLIAKNERIFTAKCDCGSESLEIVYDEHFYYFCIWKIAKIPKLSWYQRLKNCWQILLTGSVYSDQLILSKSKMKKLSNFINSSIR